MEFNTQQQGDTLRVYIVGALEDQFAPCFREYLQHLAAMTYTKVEFDLSAVSFICSSAIGRLLLFYKNVQSKGRTMSVKGMSDNVWELFQFTNVNLLFPVER